MTPALDSNVKRGFVVASLDKSPNVSGRATPELGSTEEANKSLRAKEPERNAQELYEKERGNQKPKINVVVIGHVDAGKSTLMGHLLYDMDNVPQRTLHKYEQESKKLGKQSFMYAWILDETEEERSRGITMDVGASHFETDNKMVTILDAPGHRDFIPNMITGATQADVALLVVDATVGEFETGFELGGQTREHALLVRSLGVSQLCVVVNKLDTANWSKERFDEIVNKLRVFLKSAGFKEADVSYVPCSGLTGENLVKPITALELQAWYSGPNLIKIIGELIHNKLIIYQSLMNSISLIPKILSRLQNVQWINHFECRCRISSKRVVQPRPVCLERLNRECWLTGTRS